MVILKYATYVIFSDQSGHYTVNIVYMYLWRENYENENIQQSGI